MPALQLTDVRKVYAQGDDEVVAVDHASLTLADEEILALVGPSGSGKTTLLSIAGGLLTPSEGSVQVEGVEISEFSQSELTRFRGESVGFVFQSVNLVPFLNAMENLMVVADMNSQPRGPARTRATKLLGELGLGHRTKNLPDELSGGERQRVAIGRALMNEPKLVLFDEPTSALDTKLGEQVMELIRTEVKGRGTAAVIVTHDTRMTEYADRTVDIVDGHLAA